MAYIYFDPKYKMMSFALVHHFPSVIRINCPFTYHLFYRILSGTFHVLFGRVNGTRVALTVLSQIPFVNFESLCIFLTKHIKEIFNKFVAKTHNLCYVTTITKLIYSSLCNQLDLISKCKIIAYFNHKKMNNFAITFQPISVADLLTLKVTNLEI